MIPTNSQNSKDNLSQNQGLENQIITVPTHTLSKSEVNHEQISVWQKSQKFLVGKFSKFSSKSLAVLSLFLAFSSILGMGFLANSNHQVLKNASAQSSGGGVFLSEGTILKDHEGEEFIVKIRRKEANATGATGPEGSGVGEATGINVTHYLAKKNGGADNKSYYRPKNDWNKVYESMALADTCQAGGVGQDVMIVCFKISGQRISDINQCPNGWSAMLANGPFADLPGLRYGCTLDEKDYPQMVKIVASGNGQMSRSVPDPNGRNFLTVERTGIGAVTTILTEAYKNCLRVSGVNPNKTLEMNKNIEENSSLVIKTEDLKKLKNEGKLIETSGGGINATTGNAIPFIKNAEFEIFPNISCQWPSDYTAIPAPLGNELEYVNDKILTNNNPGAVQDSNYKIFEANGAVIKESEFVACKKNSVMSTGATTKFESVICFYPNAQAKRNQIKNQEKNGATLWCPQGWEFADYDQSEVAKTGQGCYVGAGTPKYTEYAAKIDAGQIRQELPNTDPSKIESAAMPEYLKNVKIPDYLSDSILGNFSKCEMSDRLPTEEQKKIGFEQVQITCSQLNNQEIKKTSSCPSDWIMHNVTGSLGGAENFVYACKTTTKFPNLIDLFKLSDGKVVKKYGGNSGNNSPGGNSQAGNSNDKICAQVQTVGQNVNNRQEVKQFPNSCLPDGFEKVTDQMVAAVAYRMSDCQNSDGNTNCKKIDGRAITKVLDCPKGWTGSGTTTAWNFGNIQVNAATSTEISASMCVLKNSLWGEGLNKLIKLENGLLKDAGSTGQNSNALNGTRDQPKREITPTTDLLEDIAKSNDIDINKCQNLGEPEKRICKAQALQTTIESRYDECEKNDKSKWCDQDPGDLKLDNIKFSETLPKNEINNPNCNPESDTEGKMRPLNEQQCNDRKNWGYKGPFNFQTGGKRGTRNCAYVGVVKKQSYGCDIQGYLKITCDLIGRYSSGNPDQDFGKPNCKDNVIVPTTAIANAAIRSTKDVVPSEVSGVKVVVSTDIPMIPTINSPVIPTTIFEPTETKNGLEKGKIYQMTETQKSAWQFGSLNVFAGESPKPLNGAQPESLTKGKSTDAKNEADKAIATGGGAGFNIKGLDLLGINCLFTDENGKDSECLVYRITTFLRNLSYPLAILVLIWAGYQYFIGGVDGKTNGLKAVQAVITGVLIVGGATFFVDTVLRPTAESGFADTKAIAKLIDNLRAFLVGLSSSVAILVIIWGGYKFFFSGLDWEKEGGLKAIKNATIGLAIILIANTMVETLTNLGKSIGEKGDFVKGITAIITPFLTDITNLLFGLATLMAVLVIVWGGYKYFFSGLEISKKDGMDNIRNGVIGLVTVILARQIVDFVKTVVPETAAPAGSFLNIDARGFYPLFTSIVNGFLVPISTACAVFFMIMGGFYWTTSNGDENKIKKAKKALINAIIGLVIVILAVSIVQIIRFMVGGLNIGS